MLIIRRLPWNIKYIRIRCRAPVQLATLMGREYHFIKERERLRGCARHCAGMAVDENHNFYTYGQYLQVEERKTVFRSGVSSGKVQKKYVNIRCRKDLQDFLQLILSI